MIDLRFVEPAKRVRPATSELDAGTIASAGLMRGERIGDNRAAVVAAAPGCLSRRWRATLAIVTPGCGPVICEGVTLTAPRR
jgi:hypothetical protein